MAQYVFTMNRVGKIVPPKRQILNPVVTTKVDVAATLAPSPAATASTMPGSAKALVPMTKLTAQKR